MRKLTVSEFVTLDGVMQAPGGREEDTEGGFQHGAWTLPYWHDDIGEAFGRLMQGVDASLLGRKTYLIHAQAFEPLPAGDEFGDMMNAPRKYVVSQTLQDPIWRNTEVISGDVAARVHALKEESGGNILTDGSHQLVHLLLEHGLVDELHLLLYPLALGSGKRLWPAGPRSEFKLVSFHPYPSGVIGLDYVKA